MSVFAPSLSSLYKQISGYGIDPDPLFKQEGLDPALMYDSNARVPYAVTDRIAAIALEQCGDAFFGLREAEYFRPAHLGALGFSWLASPTLRQAINRLKRFSALLSQDFEVTTVEQDGEMIVCASVFLPSLAERERDDSFLATLVKMCRIVHGPGLNPTRVYSIHGEPNDTSGYYTYFQCRVEFDAEFNGFSLPLNLVDQRLSGGNEQLAQMNDHIAVKYLAHLNKNDIVNQVKTCILDEIAEGNATELEAANALHTTKRNLHRKLQAQGTSFKQLLTETRQELAEQYINDSTLTLTEISFLLGFSEASSFTRSYKRWTGLPPSEARRRANQHP